MVVPGSVSDKHLVLVALPEQDTGVDVAGDDFVALRKKMLRRWNKYAPITDATSYPTIRAAMAKEFVDAFDDSGDDDLIAVKRLPIPASGQPAHLDMAGIESGYYRVQFATE
jgi:hypothetical protein